MATQISQKSATITVWAETIKQSTSIRNLGDRLERDLTMLPHINDTCRSSYYHLRRINKIRNYLSDCGTKTLIQALVISRMDYCNSIYNGLPIKSLKKIQLVQNAAARVITKTKRCDHISPILRDLHWLPIKKRTDYKMMVLTCNARNEQGPCYIADFFKLYKPKRSLRSESNTSLVPVHGDSIQINKRLLNCRVSTTWNSPPKELRIIKKFFLNICKLIYLILFDNYVALYGWSVRITIVYYSSFIDWTYIESTRTLGWYLKLYKCLCIIIQMTQ